jgi:tagatose 1,6-diphosphate aldolase
MLEWSESKRQAMERLSTPEGIITALAIDQRGALKKMMTALGMEATKESIGQFKTLVSRELTPYASAILLDPEYGLSAARKRAAGSGLLLAYEKTGYDQTVPGRFPDLLPDCSVVRFKELGADAVKFLLYYDCDEAQEINFNKQIFVERIGSECMAEGLPFYLELLSYDAKNSDTKSFAYAKAKPRKVIEMMKEFSKPQYKVDVLKVEVPVNMAFVEGFATENVAYSRQEAAAYFKEQSDATDLPYIFLSAGVSATLFMDTLHFAKEAGARFNGVLCGRATWKDAVVPFVEEGEAATLKWLTEQGTQNILQLNEVISQTAVSWHEKIN